MKIYDENTLEEIKDPDLNYGYLYDGYYVIGKKAEVMPGTITDSNPNGLRKYVDITEPCKYYHKYQDKTKETALPRKLNEISTACNNAISSGTDVQLSTGEKKHFSYTIEDQSNISEMFNAVIMGATSYPYHADSETCEMYSSQDIVTVYATLSALKTMQTTYHNMLKQYILTLEDSADIESVFYGQQLTGEYLEKYNELVNAANEQMQIVLSKATQYTN